MSETQHVDYPHHPGTLYDCEACEEIMETEEALDADTDVYAEYLGDAHDTDGWAAALNDAIPGTATGQYAAYAEIMTDGWAEAHAAWSEDTYDPDGPYAHPSVERKY